MTHILLKLLITSILFETKLYANNSTNKVQRFFVYKSSMLLNNFKIFLVIFSLLQTKTRLFDLLSTHFLNYATPDVFVIFKATQSSSFCFTEYGTCQNEFSFKSKAAGFIKGFRAMRTWHLRQEHTTLC